MSDSTSAFRSLSNFVTGTISFSITLCSIAFILVGGLYLLIVPTTQFTSLLNQPYTIGAVVLMGLGFFINSRTQTTVMTKTGLALFAVLCIMYGFNVASKLPMLI